MSHHKHLRTTVLSVLAITCLATAAFAGGPGSNFDGVEVTGSINVVRNNVPIPVNFWDVNEASGPATIFDTAWLNVALNSTTVPITDDAIEFGFGRIAGKLRLCCRACMGEGSRWLAGVLTSCDRQLGSLSAVAFGGGGGGEVRVPKVTGI
jgi:hypothetical protein